MILLVTANKDTANNPTISSILEELKQRNIEVLLMATESQVFELEIPVVYINRFFETKLTKLNFRSLFGYIIKAFRYYSKVLPVLIKKKTTVVIGIDPEGIVAANHIYLTNRIFRRKCRLDYWSFEIMFASENATKEKEINACKNVHTVLVQDNQRKSHIISENKLKTSVNYALIPVAYPAHITSTKVSSDKNVNENLEIKLLYLGTISNWSGLEWLLHSRIPDSIKLYIHSRYADDPSLNRLLEKSELSKNIVFHDNYFTNTEDLLRFVSGFDFGICLYIPEKGNKYIGSNIEYIGLSSGKFSLYAQAGLPMIINSASHVELNNKYRFAFVAQNPDEINNIYQTITNSSKNTIHQLRENSRKVYDEFLDPTLSIRQYVNGLINDEKYKTQ